MNSDAKTTNAITPFTSKPPATISDGWDAAALTLSSNPMRGLTIVKFVDGLWNSGKEKTSVSGDKEFIAVETRQGWQFLKQGCEPEVAMQAIDGPRPPRPDSFSNEEDWPFKLNSTTEKDDPWKWTRFLFLLDAKEAKKYVYSTSTIGGGMGIDDLTSQINLFRQANPGAVPIVQLKSQLWKNNFGTRQRPFFKVAGWHLKGEQQPQTIADDAGGSNTKIVNDFADDEFHFEWRAGVSASRLLFQMKTETLVKLIPCLGSDQPNEVIAAAKAIERVLRSAGLDWHDLGNALAAALKTTRRRS